MIIRAYIPAVLGPTLKQLQDKAAEDTLSGGDIAGYLALVQAFSETCNAVPVEYLGTRPLEIAGEALPFIARKLVSLKVWSQKVNHSRNAVKEERDKKLQAMANARFPDPKITAKKIAEELLKFSKEDLEEGRALHDLLQVWDKKRKTWKLMTEGLLRKIIGKGRPRRKRRK